jgi:alanyl-tRNA synthetase
VTQRLYYHDSYLTRFTAKVVDQAEDGRLVYLDQTAFYPTSGGQLFDVGVLGGSRVVDVVDEEDRVGHRLDAPLTEAQVVGEIDWDRRFDHMQQHTGQHLLSAFFHDRFGWPTVSVHFGAETSTLDLAVGSVSSGQIAEAEDQANRVIVENRAVEVSFEDAATATGLRKPSERPGTLRIITIANFDRSACGGTHVRATGEIGSLLIRRVERVKKQARIEFVCGARAPRHARADHEVLSRLSASLSAAVEEIPAMIENQRYQIKEAASARRALEAELFDYRADELLADAQVAGDGTRRVVWRRDSGTVEELRGMAQAVIAQPKAVFLGVLAAPPTVLLAASEDSGTDAGAVLKAILARAGGRGGGSARIAQGTVADATALAAVVAGFAGVV